MSDLKFQWSLFLHPKDEQIVIRNDDFEEWVLDIQKAKTEFYGPKPVTTATAPHNAPQEPTREPVETQHYCVEHDSPMELKYSKTKFTKEGSPKPYYGHMFEGKMCFGK